jgi:hypothetical protein
MTKRNHDPRAICRKWVSRFGYGFHPDTMAALFRVAADPYECAVAALKASEGGRGQ